MTAAAHSFETLFDQSPHTIAHASGVVALAGDLGDSGKSLALASPLAAHVLVARRRDPVVHAASANADGPARCVFVLGEESMWRTWVDWVQAVTSTLREHRFEHSGFDLLVRSDIPFGVGLGSSTALVVAVLRALRDAYALGFDDEELVTLAHRAESTYGVGATRAAALACVFASDRHVLLLEDGTIRERIALPDDVEVRMPLAAPRSETARTVDVDELAAALRSNDTKQVAALSANALAKRGQSSIKAA